ncbi:MAG: cytochrome c biogenesis protein CcsA [Myxococcota bacterium]
MNAVEGALLWAAVALYAASFVLALVGSIFHAGRAGRAGAAALPSALALHLLAGVARWIATGHAPVMDAYENSLTGSWFVGVIFLALAWRIPAARAATPAVAAAVLLMLGNGLMMPARLVPLEPPFRSGWLVVHVTFAWLAFGSYVVAAIVGGLYLWHVRRAEADARRAGLLDDASGRLVAFGFAADTVMIASGAIWAHGLWGRYWAWDPIETWSLVSWLIYGVNLHLRFTLGWRGRRAAWLAVGSVVGIVVTFFGIQFVSDVHTELL